MALETIRALETPLIQRGMFSTLVTKSNTSSTGRCIEIDAIAFIGQFSVVVVAGSRAFGYFDPKSKVQVTK
jgi:hypothetical protein